MLLSMTGFVSRVIELPVKDGLVSFTVNLKSLNSRFFEVTYKIPHQFSHIEHVLHKNLKAKLVRGTVLCSIYVAQPSSLHIPLQLSLKAVENYLQSAQTIIENFQSRYHFNTELSIKDIMQCSHIFTNADNLLDGELAAFLVQKLDLLIDELRDERIKEGLVLSQDLKNRIASIVPVFEKLAIKTELVIKERKEKLIAHAQVLLKNSSDESKDSQMQLVYTQIEKMGIHEELVRFKNHIENFKQCLEDENIEKGKKLDFILQELFREINTIAAKCADSDLSNFAIAIKVELEKAREQVQNIV